MTAPTHIAETIQALWREAGGPVGDIALQACPVSGNNRVFVAAAAGQRIVAKVYFPVPDGETDRLDAEWDFLRHAHGAGVRCVPAPLACDRPARVALYEHIDGRKLECAEIGAAEVRAAGEFIAAINAPSAAATARTLSCAREACFRLDDHLAVVERRLHRLDAIRSDLPVDREAAGFAAELQAMWRAWRQRLLAEAGRIGLDPGAAIDPDERLLSPSDFGFHNALAGPGGRLTFIDFEYAGWDDVAKLAADFFYQPAVPVDRGLTEIFLDPVLRQGRNQSRIRRRIDLLRPIFGVKWCCIMLNRFLPDMAQRAAFADPGHDPEQRKREQLEKARRAFENLVKEKWLT